LNLISDLWDTLLNEMNRREAVLGLLDGNGSQSYVPAAFFTHFPAEFHFGNEAVAKHREFFTATGMDFVKIQFELNFPRISMSSPCDWASMPSISLDLFRPQLDVVQGVVNASKSEAVVVLTLYSPFMIASQIGGGDALMSHMQDDPEAVGHGLMTIAESLGGFVAECTKLGLDGFYHSTQGGESKRFSDPEVFRKWIKPADLAALRAIPRSCGFNILHICDYSREEYGPYEDLTPYLDYPGQIVCCWNGRFSARKISEMFGRPYMGGMNRKGPLAKGPIGAIRKEAKQALREAPDRFILAADCTVPTDTPWENLKAAIDVAHEGLRE